MTRDRVHWVRTLFHTPTATAVGSSWQPLVDVYRTPGGWLVKYDLAGVLPEDLTLSVHGRRLIIRGVRRDFCLEEGCSHYLLEIAYSRFERTLELPENLEESRITTESRHGMLLVRIEKEASR